LSKPDIKPAVDVLAKAFTNATFLKYYYEDETKRREMAGYFLSIPVYSGIKYGEAYAPSSNIEGVAIWIRSEDYPVTSWRLVRSVPLSVLFSFGRSVDANKRRFGDTIDAIHKRLAPFQHWFLEAIGVAPQFQGQGFAGQLLRPMLARIDKEHLPCYLDTLDKKNVTLYEHFGFQVIEESTLPDTTLTYWAMLREAH
jgi:ribosomal protein S18 acetylase RimI-like enzyme